MLPKTGNIVTDPTTNLQWQDDSTVTSNAQNWDSAVAYCDNLTLDNYSDWRLPTLTELQTIVDINNHPTRKTGFQYAVGSIYWTSDIRIGFYLSSRKVFDFWNGLEDWFPEINSNIKKCCVRGGN